MTLDGVAEALGGGLGVVAAQVAFGHPVGDVVLDGAKNSVSALSAGLVIVFAREKGSVGAGGVSAFVVPTHSEESSVGTTKTSGSGLCSAGTFSSTMCEFRQHTNSANPVARSVRSWLALT